MPSQRCDKCGSWILEKKRVYADGYEAIDFRASVGGGLCDVLNVATPADFSCAKFKFKDWSHVVSETLEGEPWQHWHMGKCPDCSGRGSGVEGGACGRCVGTGQVRYYADGYVGEERTRRHPKEPESDKIGLAEGSELAPMEKPDVISTGTTVV